MSDGDLFNRSRPAKRSRDIELNQEPVTKKQAVEPRITPSQRQLTSASEENLKDEGPQGTKPDHLNPYGMFKTYKARINKQKLQA